MKRCANNQRIISNLGLLWGNFGFQKGFQIDLIFDTATIFETHKERDVRRPVFNILFLLKRCCSMTYPCECGNDGFYRMAAMQAEDERRALTLQYEAMLRNQQILLHILNAQVKWPGS